jgi:hypothetical protein
MTETPDSLAERTLRDSESRSCLFNLPVALSHRLDRLVELTSDAGVRAHRVDVIAALILAAPEGSDALLKLHLDYGKARVKDATVHDEPVANVLHIDRAKPGRRPRTRSG